MNADLLLRRQEATVLAQQVLDKKGVVQIPVDITAVIESFGIEIVESEDLKDEVSGLMKRYGKNNSPVIAVNAAHPIERRRFTLAHELGHFLLHASSPLHVDSSEVYFRERNSSQSSDWKEMQANQFAAALLMPSKVLMQDALDEGVLTGLSDDLKENILKKLASKYNVSIQAMTIRIGSLLA